MVGDQLRPHPGDAGADIQSQPKGAGELELHPAERPHRPHSSVVGDDVKLDVEIVSGCCGITEGLCHTRSIVGPYEDVEKAIALSVLSDRATWHRYAAEDQVRRLYQGARAFAFLSEYEGLGTTPLEALAGGVPPVVLDTEVARESLGEAAVFVPFNGDVPAIARALETALFDDEVRTRVLAKAPGVLATYSWPRAAEQTLTVIESVASHQSSVVSPSRQS